MEKTVVEGETSDTPKNVYRTQRRKTRHMDSLHYTVYGQICSTYGLKKIN